jgi:hypothetical protein
LFESLPFFDLLRVSFGVYSESVEVLLPEPQPQRISSTQNLRFLGIAPCRAETGLAGLPKTVSQADTTWKARTHLLIKIGCGSLPYNINKNL